MGDTSAPDHIDMVQRTQVWLATSDGRVWPAVYFARQQRPFDERFLIF
jgi:hypothetical protein